MFGFYLSKFVIFREILGSSRPIYAQRFTATESSKNNEPQINKVGTFKNCGRI